MPVVSPESQVEFEQIPDLQHLLDLNAQQNNGDHPYMNPRRKIRWWGNMGRGRICWKP